MSQAEDTPLFLTLVDLAAADELAGTFLRGLNAHYGSRPQCRSTELEAVHALADTVASVLSAGVDCPTDELRTYFLQSLERGLAACAAWSKEADVIDVPAFLPSREKDPRLS